jgi:uncharacterized protein (DUF885 family)
MAGDLRTVDDIANAYVSERARLDPVTSAVYGVQEYEDQLTDYSPDGARERADLDRTTLALLEQVPAGSERDRRAVRAMRDRLKSQIELFESGEHLRDLSNIVSPISFLGLLFDSMPRATEQDWVNVAARLERVPWSVTTARAALLAGLEAGAPAQRRVAFVMADQASTWGGANGDRGKFARLALTASDQGDALRRRLESAASAADETFREFARFLREEYGPRADPDVGVGADHYRPAARFWTGDDLDVAETYEWGWAELGSLWQRMNGVGSQILPGAALPEVLARVRELPDYVVEGEAALQRWLQELLDSSVAALDGTHFDIDPRIHRVEAMIAPPGGALSPYYTPPSEDLSKPGRTWYPTGGQTRFPLWMEKTTCFHEGVPGHHLELGNAAVQTESMTRFQRTTENGGFSEGWALYAERLMGELGFLDDPVYELGMLSASAFRAARVVIDIGIHLGLSIPRDPGFAADWLTPGAPMTPDVALQIADSVAPYPHEMMVSEIDRYLGTPGQAISYKVGERAWVESREAARRRRGPEFELKAFHAHALSIGTMGLSQLRDELARW